MSCFLTLADFAESSTVFPNRATLAVKSLIASMDRADFAGAADVPDRRDDDAAAAASARPARHHNNDSRTRQNADTAAAAAASDSGAASQAAAAPWPTIDQAAAEQSLQAQAGAPLERCVSCLPLAAHRFYAPLHRRWLADPAGGLRFATDAQRRAWEATLQLITREQSAYQNRVADLVVRCRGCQQDKGAAASHICENHNWLSPGVADWWASVRPSSSFSSSSCAAVPVSTHLPQVLQRGMSVGTAPVRAIYVGDETRAPLHAQRLHSNAAAPARTLRITASTILSPPLHLPPPLSVTAAAAAAPPLPAPDAATAAALAASGGVRLRKEEVCFSLRALTAIASMCLEGSAPRFCIAGRVSSVAAQKSKGASESDAVAVVADFDAVADADEATRSAVAREYYHELVAASDAIFATATTTATAAAAPEIVLVRVDLADVVSLAAAASAGQATNAAAAAAASTTNATASTTPVTFLLRVPVVARDPSDGSPIVLLVKPEYSTKGFNTVHDNAGDFRLERFSTAEVLTIMLCLRCLPRCSVLVARVNVFSSSVLALERVALAQLDGLMRQLRREREFASVFSVISSTVGALCATLKNKMAAALAASSPSNANSACSQRLVIVRTVDARELSFVTLPDDTELTTDGSDAAVSSSSLSQRLPIAKPMSTAALRRMVLPVDSWMRADLIVHTFPPVELLSENHRGVADATATATATQQGDEHERDVFSHLHATVVFDANGTAQLVANAAATKRRYTPRAKAT